MNDDYFMSLAIEEARKGELIDEVPIGCVIVKDNQIIASAHNMKEEKQQVMAHAEMLAIKEASQKLGTWHLDDCTLYVTLEPCMMCTGAIVQSRIKRVVIGATVNRWPGMIQLLNQFHYNHDVQIDISSSKAICASILSNYFKKKRS